MKPKILIADDHKFVRDGLVKILRSAGYEDIVEAENGRIAVELFASEKPDIVLLDMQMPEMTGLEACEAIRAKDTNVKIAVLTMHEADDVREAAVRAGVDDYMLKSEAPKRLPELIAGLTGSAPR